MFAPMVSNAHRLALTSGPFPSPSCLRAVRTLIFQLMDMPAFQTPLSISMVIIVSITRTIS